MGYWGWTFTSKEAGWKVQLAKAPILILFIPIIIYFIAMVMSIPNYEEIRYFDGVESCWVANDDGISKYRPCSQDDLINQSYDEPIRQAKLSGYRLDEIADAVGDIAVSKTARLDEETEDSGYIQHERNSVVEIIVGPSPEKDELEELLSNAIY
jgi:hypothetical protein